MRQAAIDHGRTKNKGVSLSLNTDMALLGGQFPVSNQTRVMAANYQGSLTHPADLDAVPWESFKF
jgi:hypothetical protein